MEGLMLDGDGGTAELGSFGAGAIGRWAEASSVEGVDFGRAGAVDAGARDRDVFDE